MLKMEEDLDEFVKRLPKIELHAHLNGSLSEETLETLHGMCKVVGVVGDGTWEKCQYVINHREDRTLEECFKMFDVAYAVTENTAAVRKATLDVIKDFVEDGVEYLELRSTPRAVQDGMTKSQYVRTIIGAIRECSSQYSMIVKLLISFNRRHGKVAAEETLKIALEEHRLSPDILVGLDLSGNPETGDIDDYLPLMEKARKEGLKIAVHVAEVPNAAEVMKILDFRPDRLGHCTCIHPLFGGTEEIWQILLGSKIPIELCLTSNVKTKTVESYENHHFKYLYAVEHPITLGTDDKGVFTTTLSQEYGHAATSFGLSKNQLWELSIASIQFSFATESEKKQLVDLFHSKKNILFSDCTTFKY